MDGAIRLDDQAQLHPRKYCLGLAAAIDGGGGQVFEWTRAVAVDDDNGRCWLETDRGTITADHVIVATQLPFSDEGMFFARTHPVRSYLLGVHLDGPAPQGMYLSADTPSRSVRAAPVDGSELVLIGGESHKVGQDDDTTQRYRELEDWARRHFPVRSVDYRWSAQDYMPVDRLPFLGLLSPASEHILVATGFQKWGMTNGTAAAMMLVDRIAGHDNPWAGVFDSNRLNVRQSVSDVVQENADVVKRFVGDRLRTGTDRSVDDLAPGDAAVVAVGTERVAAYRDDTGALHAVSPVCTHLGCTVTWNTAETTWDCHLPRVAVRTRRASHPGSGGRRPRGLEPAILIQANDKAADRRRGTQRPEILLTTRSAISTAEGMMERRTAVSRLSTTRRLRSTCGGPPSSGFMAFSPSEEGRRGADSGPAGLPRPNLDPES